MPNQLTVRIQNEPFDIQLEMDKLSAGRRDIGAIVSFTGLCRDEGGRLSALELEHYPKMAEAEIIRIGEQAMERWPLTGMSVIHRVGKIIPGDMIVLVLAASAHREAAFNGANFLMDYLKSNAPFWKKEHLLENTHASDINGQWVDAKESDDKALDKWR